MNFAFEKKKKVNTLNKNISRILLYYTVNPVLDNPLKKQKEKYGRIFK